MATHSSVLAWRIPGTGEPGGLPDVYGVAQSWTQLKRLSSSSSKHLFMGLLAIVSSLEKYVFRSSAHFSTGLLGGFLLLMSQITPLYTAAAAAAKSLQSCRTLCDPIDRQPTRLPRPWNSPGKNTGVGCHFLLQCMKVKSESEIAQSCPTPGDPWTAAHQAPPSMGFSRPEYWSGMPLPSPIHIS